MDRTFERRWVGDRLRALQRGEPVEPWPVLANGEPDLQPWISAHTPMPPDARVRTLPEASQRIAYTVAAAAEECGVSPQFLRRHIHRNDLVVHYANTKPIILADDLKDWITRLPTEPTR